MELSFSKEWGKLPRSTLLRIKDNSRDKAQTSDTVITRDLFIHMLEMEGLAVSSIPIEGSKTITTRIHTHSNRVGMISTNDVSAFLGSVFKNKILRFSVVVAHDKKGTVVGCTVLRYGGKIEDATKIEQEFKAELKTKYSQRHEEIQRNREAFRHLRPGMEVYSAHEQTEFMLDFFKRHKMQIKFFPTKGNKYNPETLEYEPNRT